ncbi:MAG: DUF2905 domain-containing protein [Smithellaceae bacterium]|nr:DUF2905 domain-containing protein [Smithellaceae bacterium]
MGDLSSLGRMLIVLGIVIAALGGILLLGGKLPWLGHLPGDFHFRGKNFSFYFPLTTGLLLSIILSIILWLFNHR